jgi:hypothetical protein
MYGVSVAGVFRLNHLRTADEGFGATRSGPGAGMPRGRTPSPASSGAEGAYFFIQNFGSDARVSAVTKLMPALRL